MPVRSVVYVVSAFPHYSTTFIAHEMAEMQANGINVYVAPLWRSPADVQVHQVEREFLSKLHRFRLSDPRLWGRAAAEIVRQPRLIPLLVQLGVAHCISIYALAKFFMVAPRGLALGAWVRENRIEHIHAHFLSTPTLAALLASAVSGVPYTATIHAFDIFAQGARERNAAVPIKCARAQANIVISRFNDRYMHDHWKNLKGRFEMIPIGTDFALFRGDARALREPGQVRILSNGRFVPKKGHEYLIRALALLRRRGYPAALDLVGEGEQDAMLRSLVASLELGDCVRFLGTMRQEELVKHYLDADIFALACAVSPDGDMDGLPTVLIEALAVGLPTVSTEVSGVPEIIRDGVTGRCVAPHDPEILADALAWCIDHSEEARRLGRQGRDFVLTTFDRRKNATKLRGVWESSGTPT